MTSYSHCPADIRDAIDKYENDVKSGAIKPWNPDTRDEYHDMLATKDLWLTCHLASKLTPMHLGYMLMTVTDDKSPHIAAYLTAPKM